jgi:CBS domain containing-hemolysin-like protein
MSEIDPPSSLPAGSTPAASGAAVTIPETDGAPAHGWLDRLREAFGFKTSASLRQNLEEALSQEDALDAAFSPEERTLIRNILRLRETRVDDVMVPRADIVAVEVGTTLADLILQFETSGHSRMPVYRETLDDAIGMVHIKDLMAYVTSRAARTDLSTGSDMALDLGSVDLGRKLSETELVRSVLFVPPSMPATDLLAKMQASRTQMALVIDEYGGTDGLVSIEDVVETIVGEIDDEHDEQDGPMVRAVSPGVFVADARADLEDVAATLGPSFDVGEHDEEVDTLGGLLFSILGRIPARGEVIAAEELPGWELEVLDADPRRIKTVRLVSTDRVPARPDDASLPAA